MREGVVVVEEWKWKKVSPHLGKEGGSTEK